MSKNSKIVVVIIAGIVIICCLGVAIGVTIVPPMFQEFAEGAIIEDSDQAAEVASSLLDYDLPSGFREEGGMSILGIKSVFIVSNAGDSLAMIMLMQFPKEMSGDDEEMQRQFEDAFQRQSGQQNLSMTFTGSETRTINGEDATLSFYEGVDNEGNAMRQVIGVFNTKEDDVGMMMIIAPSDSWDSSGIESFLSSLR